MTFRLRSRPPSILILLLAAFLLYPDHVAADGETPASRVVAWHGRYSEEGRVWDLTALEPRELSSGATRYEWTERMVGGDAIRRRSVEVSAFGAHLKGTLFDENGEPLRAIEGTIRPDGKFALAEGVFWNADHPRERVSWWATFETASALSPSDRIDLNRASVAELEASGFSSSSARDIVEGRLSFGRYFSVDEALEAPRLAAGEREILSSRAFVDRVVCVHVEAYGRDETDGSDVGWNAPYPHPSFDDDPARRGKPNAAWSGEHALIETEDGPRLCLAVRDLRAPNAPAHTLAVGCKVRLEGATFEDGSSEKTIVLLRFHGRPRETSAFSSLKIVLATPPAGGDHAR